MCRALKPSEQTLRTLHCVLYVFHPSLSLTSLHDREVFGTGVCRLIIILLLCTHPQTLGGRDVKGTSGLIHQLFHPGALCCVWLDCLNVSWYQGTQTSRLAGLVGRIRNEGETEAILLLVWRELCWNKHLSPPNNDHRGWAVRERNRRQSEERKTAPNSKEKWISPSNSFPSLSLMFFFPSHSSFLSLPHIQTT